MTDRHGNPSTLELLWLVPAVYALVLAEWVWDRLPPRRTA